MTDVRRQLEAYEFEDAPDLGKDPWPTRADYAMFAFKALEAVLKRHDFHTRLGNHDCRCNLCVAVRDISSALPDVPREER